MRKTGSIIAIFMILLMILSCTNSTPDVARADVKVMLDGSFSAKSDSSDSGSDTPSGVATYSVSLGAITEQNGKWVISSDQTKKRNESFPGSVTEFVIRSVELGNYSVIIDAFGYDGKTKIYNGTANKYISVTENGSNSVVVSLASIDTNRYTGSASMTFSWAEIAETNETVKETMKNGGFIFILYYYDSGTGSWVEAGRSSASGTSATTYQFEVSKLPVATDLKLKYALSASNGIILNPELVTTTTQIFPNLVSIQKGTEGSDIYKIADSQILSSDNVYDVTLVNGPIEGSSVTFSWKNQMKDGISLFDYVTVRYSSAQVSEKRVNINVDGYEESSFTIEDMALGDEYTVSFQAHHKTGFVSSFYTYPEKVRAEILLDAPVSISVKPDGNEFLVQWSQVEGADSYAIYRSENNREFTFFKSISGKENTSYRDGDIYSFRTYAYKVMGMYAGVEGDISVQTPSMYISDNRVSVPRPDLGDNFSIMPSEPDKLVIYPDSEGMCVSLSEISGVTEYTWLINDSAVKTAAAANGGTFANILDDASYGYTLKEGLNSLKLSVKTASNVYESAPVDFMVVRTESTGVDFDSVETRVSSIIDPKGTVRTIQLSNASTLPANSTVKDVMYKSETTDIATVDDKGLITFTGKSGTAKIKVYPKYFEDVAETIEFEVYKPTITSAEQIVSIINDDLHKALEAANDIHKDWWTGFVPSEGEEEDWTFTSYAGYTISSSTESSQNAGSIIINKTIDSSLGPISVNGTLTIYAKDEGWDLGYLGIDPLQYVGYGNESLSITLPDNQGKISIRYNKVDVDDTNRVGAYTVIINEESPIGYNGELKGEIDVDYTYKGSIDLL